MKEVHWILNARLKLLEIIGGFETFLKILFPRLGQQGERRGEMFHWLDIGYWAEPSAHHSPDPSYSNTDQQNLNLLSKYYTLNVQQLNIPMFF